MHESINAKLLAHSSSALGGTVRRVRSVIGRSQIRNWDRQILGGAVRAAQFAAFDSPRFDELLHALHRDRSKQKAQPQGFVLSRSRTPGAGVLHYTPTRGLCPPRSCPRPQPSPQSRFPDRQFPGFRRVCALPIRASAIQGCGRGLCPSDHYERS